MSLFRSHRTKQDTGVLIFDSECRPMHFSEWRAESQITGIAWSWLGEETIYVETLQQDMANEADMLRSFLEDYEFAGLVVGHYIRRHDLPLLSDHTIRLDLPMKATVLTTDTQADLPKVKGLGKSQENLAATLGLPQPKHHMTGAEWRIANALTDAGRLGTRRRVVSDVEQNKALYIELRDRGLLQAPKAWKR